MWSGAVIFVFLTVSTNRISAKFFSDAGSFKLPGDSQPVQEEQYIQDPAAAQYYDMELNRDQLSPYQPQQQPYDDEKLAGIVDELQKMQGAEMPNDEVNFQAYQENPYYDINEAPSNFDAEAFKNLKVQETEAKPAAKADEKEKPDQVVEPNQPMTAQKKGQSEFVGFVEPVQAKQLKNVEIMDKRVPMESRPGQPVQLIQSSSNVVFIALVTMCCVVAVVGVVGGAYYYNHIRKSNNNTFDDFTRYSPAGPGKDKKLKKSRNGSGGSVTENGDECLAYKAQLHHYQQTKQKIIGAEEGMAGIPGVEDDDKSDDELEEHNFSVYECPGLAPTGDIEVQNPNFDVKRTSSP